MSIVMAKCAKPFGTWRKLLLGTSSSRHLRSFSSSSELESKPVYELRTYSVRSDQFKNYLELTKEKLHLRIAHSKLIGFWVIELGALNAVTHIWEYDSLAHRTQVRTRLAQDDDWCSQYLARMMPMLHLQDSSLLTPLHDVVSEARENGAYELRSYVHGAANDREELALSAGRRSRGMLCGSWAGLFGSCNTMYQLWGFKDQDEAVAAGREVLSSEQKAAFERAGVRDVTSKLLVPLPFSPLQ